MNQVTYKLKQEHVSTSLSSRKKYTHTLTYTQSAILTSENHLFWGRLVLLTSHERKPPHNTRERMEKENNNNNKQAKIKFTTAARSQNHDDDDDADYDWRPLAQAVEFCALTLVCIGASDGDFFFACVLILETDSNVRICKKWEWIKKRSHF